MIREAVGKAILLEELPDYPVFGVEAEVGSSAVVEGIKFRVIEVRVAHGITLVGKEN